MDQYNTKFKIKNAPTSVFLSPDDTLYINFSSNTFKLQEKRKNAYREGLTFINFVL